MKDLRELPLLERKNGLGRLLRKSRLTDILAAQFVEERGTALFAEICKLNLEGIVAKRKDSVYSTTLGAWLKIKNSGYTDADGRREKFEAFREHSAKRKP
jgi:ATP-dependent DNA ligase